MTLEKTLLDLAAEVDRLKRRVDDLERVEKLFIPTWDDLRVSATSTKAGGSKDPGYAKFIDDAAGTSQGCFIYWFDASTEEEVYFEIQIPHAYKAGSDIIPHVHWVPKSNGTSGHHVSWGLEYAWVDIGDVYGDTTFIYGNAHDPADAVLVANKHYLTDLTTISGAGMTLSSMLVCRLFRNATAAGSSADEYGADAGLLEFDLHFQSDALGSREETVK